MFWIIASALTIIAVLIAFFPLVKSARNPGVEASEEAEFDTAVYRDQLAELDADRARGAIDAVEFDQARVEVARRIIAVENRRDALTLVGGGGKNGFVGPAFALLFVPAITLLFYLETGSPELEAQPLAARLNQVAPTNVSQEITLMLERAEEHLTVNPNDVRGWDVVAPVYLRINRYDKAVTAYGNAISLDGATVGRLSGLGEAMVSANGGIVSGEALTRFQAALQIDRADARSNFFVALAAAQSGNLEEAEKRWLGLFQAGDQERWTQMAQTALARLPSSPTRGAAPQVDDDQRQAISQLPTDERNEMILSMVEGLDDRLKTDPNDLEGWMRLIRARMVLGQTDLAQLALANGARAFEGDEDARSSLLLLAKELNLALEEEGT